VVFPENHSASRRRAAKARDSFRLFCFAVLLIFSPAHDAFKAFAQSGGETKITAEPVISLTANVEMAFPVRIESTTELPKRTTLLIKGIPGSLTLTQGRVFDSGLWFVPAADLPKLRVQASSQAVGLRSPLSMTLVSLDGTVLAESNTVLEVRSAAGDAAGRVPTAVQASTETQSTSSVITTDPEGLAASPQGPAGKALSKSPELLKSAQPLTSPEVLKPPQPLTISPAEEEERLKSGQEAWDLDDVAGARLIFGYLASRGSAAGAWRLAQTYDPHIIARTTVGARFKPDEAVAAKWYAKAAAMGHEEARKKIAGNR
jgi:hypothetical protein